jgi:hypothetical protein
MKLDDCISSVNWKEIKVASGSAEHVSEALIGLLSPDEETQNRSYWRLDNELVLQSDLYEAAYYATPILIQMLADSVPHGRERIYDLLYEIANGYAPMTTLCRTRDGRLVPLREACAKELASGVGVFNRDTNDEDPCIGAKARELVELIGEHAPGTNSGMKR